MSSFKFQKNILATTVAMVITGASAPVLAAEEAASDVEVIEVRGIRGSMKENINAKRFSDSVVDVITSEDIGKFPDKNVAESLSRITGVGVSREYGEGEKITIRGAGPTKNRTLLNGQNVATADWFILDNPSRGFNFTLLPSSLVKGLEVYKTPEASIDEGSIGGTVVMNTRKPLELDANHISIGLQGQYSETSEETDPQIDALYSWKNEAENFGVLVSVTKQDRTVQREGVEVLGWTPADANGMKAPKDIGNPIFIQDRERETIFASIQYAPSDNLDFTLNILDSSMDANNANVNLLIRPQNNLDTLVNTKSNGNNIYAGEVTAAGSYEWDFINRESSTETSSYDLEMNYSGDGYSIHAQVGTTEAEGGTYNEASWSFVPNVDDANKTYAFDLSGTPSIDIGVDPLDGSQWGQNWTWGGNKPTTDEETYAQLDLTFDVDYGAFYEIKTGIKYRDHDRSQGRQAYSWHGPETLPEGVEGNYMEWIFEQCPTLADCGQSTGSHKVADDVVNGNVVEQLKGSRSQFMTLAFDGYGDVPADYAVSNVLSEIWDINESILALYAQGNFSGDGFRGNLGIRVVQTEQESSSYNFSQDSWGFHTVDREWLTPTYMEWVTEDRDYTEILPSFNIAFDVTEDQIVRFGAARVMARPNFSDLAPIETTGALNVEFPTGTAGNPNLDPQIADQFDMAWEWYFDESALLSVTYFYKDIQSYRTSGTTVKPFYDQENDQLVDVTLTRPDNGLGGSTDGIELGYQQAFGNFGLSANYTYTNADTDQTRDEMVAGSGLVEGASEHMYNVTAYYENDTFGARLMYNFRTEWYKGLHFSGDEVWNDEYGQLDFSSSYKLTENVSLSFEAVNISDEEVIEYNTDPARLMSVYQNGRRFVAGVNLTF
ncbi:TonB-dependent receptor [Thalassotalea crassostreae]|uniref:TonB-dependent receptor n=1 Tax=Thalassotalea crassostreae TaxID=1763536 RepID=UPI000837CF6E|nr:TonB-dependent receptor [Thalassotalea crassostreae]